MESDPDPVDEGSNFSGHEVVDRDGDSPAPGPVHKFRSLLDCLGPVHLGPAGAGGAAGDVDRRAGGAELDGDSSPGAPRGSGDQGDPA